LRFDVYDYYCSEPKYGSSSITGPSLTPLDDSFVFQTKYYENIDVVSLEIRDFLNNTKLYDVIDKPLNFAPGATDQPPVDDLIQDPIKAIWGSYSGEGNPWLAVIMTSIIGLTIVIVLTVCFPQIMTPVIKGTVNLIGLGFESTVQLFDKITNGIKNIVKRE
jgi:hypothetical protein